MYALSEYLRCTKQLWVHNIHELITTADKYVSDVLRRSRSSKCINLSGPSRAKAKDDADFGEIYHRFYKSVR